jgi:ribosomal protein S12 methylthiotransferase
VRGDDAGGPDLAHLDAPHAEHHHTPGATGRSKADAPEIDGEVHLRDAGGLKPGDIVRVRVEDADEHDLYGVAA